MRPIGTAKSLEKRRRQAIQLFEKGYSQAQVAREVKASHSSVHRWRQAHQQHGSSGLCAKPHPGAPPKLMHEQLPELEAILLRGAEAAGYATNLWTCKRVRDVIKKRFGISYHEDSIWHLLRNRLSWTAQKPQRKAREADEDKIAHWRSVVWPRLKKS